MFTFIIAAGLYAYVRSFKVDIKQHATQVACEAAFVALIISLIV